ncbi:MAG TPA: GAF domain-containing protein [Solirubrobacteraceae bacterium]|nr:GAF domain-containing protein [Solirubrobacteraceae bacterium]
MSAHQEPLSSEAGRRAMLQSIVALVLAVFGAKACSIMRFDEGSRELVFEAVAGEGEDTLVGRRIPASTGIAGWSLASEEPISIDDVLSHPRFDREVAEQTGYVPTKLTVFPLLYGEESLGVLSVLDAGATAHFGLAGMESLAHFASHAAMTLAAVAAARRAEASRDEAPLQALAEAIDSLGEQGRRRALTLIAALEPLIRQDGA